MKSRKFLRSPFIWIVAAVILFIAGAQLLASARAPKSVSTWEAVADINKGNVKTATISDREQFITLTLNDGTRVQADYQVDQGSSLISALETANAAGRLPGGYNVSVTRESIWITLLINFLPVLLLVFLMFFFMGQVNGSSRAMSFGRARTKPVNKDVPKTTFADVAGADEAVEELQEIKEFLANPSRFQAVGAKIPRGVLLYGPPGTGKTLLARAVAGEAGVPFFSISGSDFVEMFVGVGASRVRDLFEQAKQSAPAIIFVDEIDAVGRQRGAGLGGGHDEREQTLNQLLVEMDGFEVTTSVILIAATNRPDILDPALLRPGRFDRQISVSAPDLIGREQILEVHAKGKPLSADVDLTAVAKRTPGFTGADLANVLNEAALLTARNNAKLIDNASLDEAIDRVIAGPQKRTRVMSESEKLVTAYHEGGHALVAAAMPNGDPVHKVTILPRGRALGYTMVLPEEDKYSVTRSAMLGQIAYMLGGRAAEELIFHDPTTGASNDIEKATGVARAMVTQYGMTERLGAVRYGQAGGDVFMGRDFGHQRDYSEDVAAAIDDEVRKIIDQAHQEAFDVLIENRAVLDALVVELLERETLGKDDIARIFEPVKVRPTRPAWTGSSLRVPSDIPPVSVAPAAVAPVDEKSSTDTAEPDSE